MILELYSGDEKELITQFQIELVDQYFEEPEISAVIHNGIQYDWFASREEDDGETLIEGFRAIKDSE